MAATAKIDLWMPSLDNPKHQWIPVGYNHNGLLSVDYSMHGCKREWRHRYPNQQAAKAAAESLVVRLRPFAEAGDKDGFNATIDAWREEHGLME